ncbi:calcium-translocating P-type ATPase, PMCA-type [Sinanaerobacter chloroacetimidivorans]|uniref:P-type Ca(2+) transporter n=1 Tax=Sinanaerobacter chloroacetimidivorans TaxID=2818044 RepID=A0A8J8B1I9_9FIRM|nr:calcium-translocating P-type ATPase, PMCA-type [Sinanaerobacter chloroacetimidivorans]MBR0598763.1 calcium-translocating P-type ATPase, PMCA-type [Sinanaerobacter chloroacetimidivorans]
MRKHIGLNPSEVAESRKIHGGNVFAQKKRKGFLKQYLSSFGDPIIKILLVALALNIIFLFRDANWMESAGIAIAVFLATFVSTLSEYGSESAFAKLMEEAQLIQCRLIRSGQPVSVPITEVVTGDIVLLQAGEKIPADGILLSGILKVDQSALNGESKAAAKFPSDSPGIPDSVRNWDLLASHQLFRGSVVDEGEGIMEVCRVGKDTFYGHMAGAMQEETRESPLKLRLGQLAKTISRLGYIAACLVALADLCSNVVLQNSMNPVLILRELTNLHTMTGHVLHALTLAITIVVVAVPEGLPMMITVVLSSNTMRMMRDNVLVRKLVGIETAGSLNILFTDKTGTLTQGKLSVSHLITGEGKIYRNKDRLRRGSKLLYLLTLSGFYNTGCVLSGEEPLGGNMTDRALLDYVLPIHGDMNEYVKMDSIPFDSTNKFSAARISGPTDLSLIKGAPEKLLCACTRYFDEEGRIQRLCNQDMLESLWHKLSDNAVRVLVIAATEKWPVQKDRFSDLILIGIVGIRDELRPEAYDSVRQVTNAGVQVVMVTGDNQETAVAIARGCGLIDVYNKNQVITSTELGRLTDDQLKSVLPQLRVVARALPTDKSRLVSLAQEMGMVAGMTGDGINDGPALKIADVGFAMGDGTEVAKEAGDIVILDNNIASIAKAILYGRTIFKSIQKFIIFQLTMNLCAVGVSLIGPFIGFETPITVIQMLWVNIIMDTLAGLAFAGEPPLEEYMEESPKSREEPVLNGNMVNQIMFAGLVTITICMLFLTMSWVKVFFHYHLNPICFYSAFFTLFIFCGIFNSFNARTPRINLTAYLSRNPAFILIMSFIAIVQILLLYLGGSLFRTIGLTFSELAFTLGAAAIVVPADVIRKIMVKKIRKVRRL